MQETKHCRPKYYSRRDKKPNQAYIIYDASIEDIEERKNKAMKFTSARDVKLHLGLNDYKNKDLNSYCDPEAQKRFYSDKHNKSFIIRKLKAMPS